MTSQQDRRFLGRFILVALNWLQYMTLMECDGGHVPFFRSPPSNNPWEFTADPTQITKVLVQGFRLPAKDPTEVFLGVHISGLDEHYAEYWERFHRFLVTNQEGLANVPLDLQAITEEKREGSHDPEEVDDTDPSTWPDDMRLKHFILLLSSGAIKEQDLLAKQDTPT